MSVHQRGRKRSWDIDAEVYLEPEELPLHLKQLLGPYEPYDEVEVSFNAKGYDDPGYTTGLPEHCYPAEGDEERLIERVRVRVGREPWREVAAPIFRLLERDEFLLAKVDAQELDYQPEEPDYDLMYERARERREGW
jgi:hypothetical protein